MHRRVLSQFALALAGLVMLVVFQPQYPRVASAQPAPAPQAAGTIAYVVGDDAGDQIWLIEPDGSHSRKIYSTGVASTSEYISSLAWRPDAGELIFTSNYERLCSWYEYDVYAILSDGSGYRRVTNSPACASLGGLPQGGVALDNSAAYGYAVYVQGAPGPKFGSAGSVGFDQVADFGNVQQPIIIYSGDERAMGGSIDVKAGQAVGGQVSVLSAFTDSISANGPVWKRDGSQIGYAFGCEELRGIADHPAPGDYGQRLFDTNNSTVRPCVMAYGPTPETANEIVYYSDTGNPSGFYRTTENGGPGTEVITSYGGHVFQIQWLPDASGFIYTMTTDSYSSDIYRYDFASDKITQLTQFSETQEYALDFSISPDGQTIIFERAPYGTMGAYGMASDLWTIGTDGSNPQLLVKGGQHPSWSLQAIQLPPPGPNPTPSPIPGPNPSPVPSRLSNKLYIPFVRR